MAKIEMEISEYEAMKENKKLLENSLEKERGLQEQIKKLTDEKTKALEDAKMKVVKISKTEVTEHILRKKEDVNIWRELWNLMGIDYRQLPKMPEFIHTDHLINVFFERVKSYSMPNEETTTHGLDEIKAEIRNDLKTKIDDDTKRKLENADVALSKNNELLKENKTLISENSSLTEKNKKLTEQCDELTKKLTDVEDANETLNKVREALKNGYGFWNKAELLDKIMDLIKIA